MQLVEHVAVIVLILFCFSFALFLRQNHETANGTTTIFKGRKI